MGFSTYLSSIILNMLSTLYHRISNLFFHTNSFLVQLGKLIRGYLLFLAVLSGPYSIAQNLVHNFEFNGNLNDSEATGISLSTFNTATSAFQTSPNSWTWTQPTSPGGGLILQTSELPNPQSYSLGFRIEYDQVGTGYKKIVSFKGDADDNGLYFIDSKLVFYPFGRNNDITYQPNTFYDFIFVRDSTDNIKVYIVEPDGTVSQVYDETDTSDSSVPRLVGSNYEFRFFMNDNVATEHTTGGTVRGIRLWDAPLNAAEIAGALSSVTTNPASDITFSSATLNGSVNPQGTSATFEFEYGTSTAYGQTIAANPASGSGSSSLDVTASITGLTPGTTYHYRLKSTNTAGDAFGSDQTFTTVVAPGNVAGMTLWLDAADPDADGNAANNPSDGDEISTWKDKSGNGNDVTIVGVANPYQSLDEPSYLTDQFNGQPALRFEKINREALGVTLGAEYIGDYTVFMVLQGQTDNPQDYESFFSSWDTPTNNSSFQIDFVASSNAFQVRAGSSNVSTLFKEVSEDLNLFAVTREGTVLKTYSDGAFQNQSDNAAGAGFNAYRIGINRAGSQFYDSKIAEVIIYHKALDACELEKVNNYLGEKYGRDFNNVAANYGIAADYTTGISGIGAFPSLCAGNITQDQASSSILTISNPSSNDTAGEFLTFAHNDAPLMESAADLPGSLGSHLRIAREWKFDRDGNVGSVDLVFDLSSLNIRGNQEADFLLLIDDDGDGDFTTGAVRQVIPSTYQVDEVTFDQLVIPNNGVVTLVTYSRLPAPAGVSGDNLWLKADAGIGNNGNTLSRWEDQSENNQFTVIGSPQINSQAINFNPSIDFDGNGDVLQGNEPIKFQNLYAVLIRESDSNTDPLISVSGSFDGNMISGKRMLTGSSETGSAVQFISTGELTILQTKIAQAEIVPGASITDHKTFINGKFYNTRGLAAGSLNPFTGIPIIGGKYKATDPNYFDGQIAELIMYPASHTDEQRIKINSYLAVKYGITLDPSVGQYITSNGTTIWNNTNYWNDIFGIGKDDTGTLNQIKSNSINSGSGNGTGQTGKANVVLSNPSSLDDGDFLMIGHNGKTLDIVRSYIRGYAQFPRYWKVKHTGNIGTVNLSLNISGLQVTGTLSTDFELAIDVDGNADLSNGVVQRIRASSLRGNVLEFGNVSLPDGAVFTLIEKLPLLPKDFSPNRIIVNPSFETGSIVPHNDVAYPESQVGDNPQIDGWYSTHPTYQNAEGAIEHWRTGFLGTPSSDGDYFVELNVSQPSRLYQNVFLVNGESVDWAFSHRARGGGNETVSYAVFTSDGSRRLKEITSHRATGNTTWDNVSGNFIWDLPTGLYQIGFEAISPSSGGSGNFLDDVNIVLKAFVEFSADTIRLSESGQIAPHFLVNGEVQQASSLQVTVNAGSAVEGTDYSFGNRTKTIPIGNYSLADSVALDFSIIDNNVPQNDRTIILEITNASGDVDRRDANANGIYQRTLVIIIEDDDPCKDPGQDNSFSVCAPDAVDLNLPGLLGGSPDPGGAWVDVDNSGVDLTDPTNVDFTGLGFGVYHFTYDFAQLGICAASESELTIEIRDPFPAGEDATVQVCNSSGIDSYINLFESLGGSPKTGGNWVSLDPSVNITNVLKMDFSSFSEGTYQFIYGIQNQIECDGREAFAYLNVVVNDLPDAGSNSTINACDNTTGFDLITHLGGTPDAGGTWSAEPGNPSVIDLSDPSNVDFTGTPGKYKFRYTVAGQGACQEASSILTVNVSLDHDPGVDGSVEVCNGQLSLVNLFDALGGTPDPGGTWTETTAVNPSGVLIRDDIGNFIGIDPGDYTFQYSIPPAPGCNLVTSTVTLTVNDAPDAGLDNTISVCDGGPSTVINLFTSLGGTPDPGGNWSNVDGATVNLTDPTNVDFSGVSAGSYDFTYTVDGPGACNPVASTLTVNVNFNHNAGLPTAIVLCNDATAPINLFETLVGVPDPGGAWTETSSVSSGVSLANTLAVDFSGVPAGIYEFTYTIAGEGVCFDVSNQLSIQILKAIDAGNDTSIDVCNGEAFPINLYDQIGGNPDPGGSWLDLDGSGVNISNNVAGFAGVPKGSYRFLYTVSDPNQCTPRSSVLTVEVGKNPDPGKDGYLIVCDGGSSTVRSLEAALGGTPDTGGSWLDVDGVGVNLSIPDAVDFVGIAAGTYRFDYIVQGSGSCSDQKATVTVFVNQDVNAGTNTEVTLCEFQVQPIDLLSLLDGNPDAGGNWSFFSSETFDITDPTAVDVGNLLGRYVLEYTVNGEGACSSDVAVLTLNVEDFLDAGDSGNVLEICPVEQSIIDVESLFGNYSAGGTFSISPDISGIDFSSPATVDFSSATPGTYELTYNVNNSCGSYSASNTIVINAPANAGENSAVAICNTENAYNLIEALGGTPDLGGYWSNNNQVNVNLGNGTAVDFTNVKKGTYRFTYHVESGACSVALAFVDVTVEGVPYAGIDKSILLCDAGNLSVDFLGSIAISTSQVQEWNDVDGSGVDLSDLRNVDFTGVPNGRYSFTHSASATTQCPSSTATLTIIVNENGNPGTDAGAGVCVGQSVDLGSLLGTFDPGGVWSDDDGAGVDLFDPANVEFDGVTPGTYRFTYTLSATAGCSNTSSATVTLTVGDIASSGEPNTISVCNNGSLDLFNSLKGSPDAGGSWSEVTSSGVDLTDPSQVDFSGVAAGRYEFAYSQSDPNCGILATQLIVNVGQDPSAGVDANLMVCNDGSSYDLLAQIGSADPGGVWIDANNSGVSLSNPKAVTFENLAAGTYDFVYEIVGLNGCNTASSMVTVVVSDKPNAGIGSSLSICLSDGPIDLVSQLSGNPDGGGNWVDLDNSGIDLSDPTNVDLSGLASGRYHFNYIVTDPTGNCTSATSSVIVDVTRPSSAGTPVDQNIVLCNSPGSQFDLTSNLVNSDEGGVWTLNGQMIANPASLDISALAAGFYEVDYTSSSDGPCQSDVARFYLEISGVLRLTNSIILTENDDQIVNLMMSLGGDLATGGSWQDVSNAGVDLGDPTAVDFSSVLNGTYVFTYTVSNPDCGDAVSELTVNINRGEDKEVVDASEGFTPNGDGINDYLLIDRIADYPNNRVSIYNAYGDLVYQVINYNNADRRFEGIANKSVVGSKTLPSGTYFYAIELPNVRTITGYFTLVK